MTGATSFDDSVVRFTDSETVYDTDPSDKSLGYFHNRPLRGLDWR